MITAVIALIFPTLKYQDYQLNPVTLDHTNTLSYFDSVSTLEARLGFIFDLQDFQLQTLFRHFFLPLQLLFVSPRRFVDDDPRLVHRAIQSRCFTGICADEIKNDLQFM